MDIYSGKSQENGILQRVRTCRPERKERNMPLQTPLPPSKEKNGKTKPRLTPGERLRLENPLDDGCTPYRIARTLGLPPKTILAKAREGVNITEEELSARPRGQDAVRPVHAEVRPGSRGPLQQPADSGERNRPQAEIHLAAGVINNCDLLRFPRQREYHQVPRSPRLLGRPRRPFD